MPLNYGLKNLESHHMYCISDISECWEIEKCILFFLGPQNFSKMTNKIFRILGEEKTYNLRKKQAKNWPQANFGVVYFRRRVYIPLCDGSSDDSRDFCFPPNCHNSGIGLFRQQWQVDCKIPKWARTDDGTTNCRAQFLLVCLQLADICSYDAIMTSYGVQLCWQQPCNADIPPAVPHLVWWKSAKSVTATSSHSLNCRSRK